MPLDHPILDQTTFRLWLREARVLRDEIIAAFGEPADARELANEAQITGVAYTAPIDTVWLDLLNCAAQLGLLRKLLARIRVRQVPPTLIAALNAVDNVSHLGGSLDSQRMVLKGPKVFLDRSDLRKHLPKMRNFSPNGAILVVRGLPKTGRSETQSLLFDQNADQKVFVDALVPLKDTIRLIWKKAAGATIDPPASHTGEAGTFIAFWNDVQVALEEKNRRMWLLFDDLDKGAHRDQVTLLAETLANRMSDVTFQNCFRLVLLGYPKSQLATKVKPLEEQTHELDDTHVRDFVQYCCDITGKNAASSQIDAIAERLCVAARAVLARAKGEGEEVSFGEAINAELLSWYEDFSQ